jgi:hypothetical protein
VSHLRHWRLDLALKADRVERRLGRWLTSDELQKLAGEIDMLRCRELAVRSGARVVNRGGWLGIAQDGPSMYWARPHWLPKPGRLRRAA